MPPRDKVLNHLVPIPAGAELDQFNYGQHVNTSQVQETVHIFMGVITILIIVFLAVHLFMRFHYKAKTEYAMREFSEKYERQMRGPSPYAVPQPDITNEVPVVGKPTEVLLEPAQLAPILHHVALAPPQPIEQPNQSVFYTENP